MSTVTEQDPGTSYDDDPAEDDGVLDPSDSLETGLQSTPTPGQTRA